MWSISKRLLKGPQKRFFKKNSIFSASNRTRIIPHFFGCDAFPTIRPVYLREPKSSPILSRARTSHLFDAFFSTLRAMAGEASSLSPQWMCRGTWTSRSRVVSPPSLPHLDAGIRRGRWAIRFDASRPAWGGSQLSATTGEVLPATTPKRCC